MGIFRFRRFSVENMESAMKVNTDGVLLGALMTVRPHDRKCLDVGTGTGTIALMAAQRLADCAMAPETVTANIAPAGAPGSGCKIMIFGIDIDEASAREAGRNFAASFLWVRRMPGAMPPDTPSRFLIGNLSLLPPCIWLRMAFCH